MHTNDLNNVLHMIRYDIHANSLVFLGASLVDCLSLCIVVLFIVPTILYFTKGAEDGGVSSKQNSNAFYLRWGVEMLGIL